MEGTAVAISEILRYLIIHWKCETAGVSKKALLEGQLVISTEAFTSKHHANVLHCVTTITSGRSNYDGLGNKKFVKEVQSILSRLSAKLTWSYKDASGSPDTSGSSFQMMFEVDEKPRTLRTDGLAVKNFLRRIIVVHPKITFHFSVKVNGALAKETIRAENEPIFNLPNGIALIINEPRYVRPTFGATEFLCSRIHPVPGQPVTLSIPDDVAGMGLLGELILMPVAALCSCLEASSNQMDRISSVSMFLYGPSGLPLLLPGQRQPTTVFTDPSCFIDWKKYDWCVTPHLDFNLDGDLVLPDMRCQAKSCEGRLSQDVAPQGQTLLLFIFVDFHSGFPAQQMELWGAHTLLASHLNAILLENQRGIRGSVQMAVDQALEQQQHAAKARQKLQASHTVAVDSILSVVSGSTSSSFRRGCLQALQAADTQEFGTKLHNAFKEITQHRFPYHCSCEIRQQLPSEKTARSHMEARRSHSPEHLSETTERANSKRRKGGVEETRAYSSTPSAPGSSDRAAREQQGRVRAPSSAGPGSGLEVAEEGGRGMGLACSYVGSLYVWKSELPRDHPAVIKRRFTSVLVVSSLSPLCVLLWRELTGIQVRGAGQRQGRAAHREQN
ncbi:type 2 DNA topoisomerase 6 subunit B-like [Echinops telfairi]|uniref:Type 2 DNA topoisomerase 6 subunit B-like n=1 Tax=Echinops telfairi TaxID=9371 RepID=A0AC55DMX0_ECHTE|nr:type 2 DNA topoisomerase 6 subunit B-like [Echinops telfairi]